MALWKIEAHINRRFQNNFLIPARASIETAAVGIQEERSDDQSTVRADRNAGSFIFYY